jgi:hypothetical protein
MLDAELVRFARWMERVRKQKESRYQLGFRGAEDRRLPSTVGVAAEKYSARNFLSHGCDRIPQARAVALRITRRRRSASPFLPERKVAAQN